MFKNYFVTTIRALLNNRLFSIINIGGLALSLMAAIMILLFVNDEVSFDKFWAKSENIYRMELTLNTRSQGPIGFANSVGPMANGLEASFPEIEDVSRLFLLGETMRHNNQLFAETVGYVDPAFLEILSFEFIAGDPASAINDNQSLILTRSSAEKYFGDRNPIGEVLTMNSTFSGEIDYRVSAVVEDLPLNSHLAFGSLALFDSNRYVDFPFIDQQWNAPFPYLYVKLQEGADPAAIEAGLPQFVDTNAALPARFSAYYSKPSEFVQPSIRPVGDIHLYSNQAAEIQTPGSITTVYIFLVVAVLLIFIAAVNFINMTTARASIRAKEIGLRKVMGAAQGQIRSQFLMESILFVFLALFLAVGAVQLLLPWYNEFLAKDLTLANLFQPLGFLLLILGGAALGVLSGLYPAFFLASFKPAATLSANKGGETRSTVRLRKALVIGQFAITGTLIIISAIIYLQMQHLQERDLGFDEEGVTVLTLPGTQATQDLENFKRRIDLLQGVELSGLATFAPGTVNALGSSNFFKPGDDQQYGLGQMATGIGFFEALEIDLLAGRTFSNEFALDLHPAANDPADTNTYSVILNESAVSQLGYESPQDAIGKTFSPAPGVGFFGNVYQVVGVVPDIQLLTAFQENRPAFFFYQPAVNSRGGMGTLLVKISGDNRAGVLAEIETAWNQAFPNSIFTASELPELLEAVYANEQKQSQSFRYFMILSMALSALGLYGLAAFTADRRTREIGVRKVMGATIPDILKLLVWQFSKPVVVASVLAWPIAWIYATDWLESFTQRIDMTVFPFIGAAVLAVLVAWVTVIGHAYRVAKTNPINALRYE